MGGIGGKTEVVVVAGVIAHAESKIEVKGIVKTITVVKDIDVVVTVVEVRMMEGILVMTAEIIDGGIVIEDIAHQVAGEALLVIEIEVLGGKVVLKGERKLISGIENARENNH